MMHRFAVCATCLLVFAPQLAPAVGLGAIEVRSALNTPLDARIPLTRIRSGDLEGLKVALGSPAQFELAGIARLPVLESIEFSVVEQDGGGGYIHVRTDAPISEPSLTFLIEADWPRGRTVRGYKLHLAPAVAGGTPASGRAAPEAKREPGTGAPAPAPASPPASGDATVTVQPGNPSREASTPAPGGAGYGPVRASDTLWSIATRVRPDDSVSVQRMMLALLEANPEAFAIRNVNALNAGVTLRIPGRDELGPDDRKAAIAELKRQQAAWAQYREGVRAAPAPSTPAPSTPAPSAPAPSPGDTEPEPSGRIEVVSPETAMNAAGGKEDADIRALRNELALAVEEADASRRENAELKFRLAEIEGQIKELIRLVALKSEEIAALQAELRAMAAMRPKPVPPQGEAEPGSPAGETEPGSPQGETEPGSPQGEAESGPPQGEAKPASSGGEAKSLPFGLGALPISPVFLVGGAGLLLILLGVVALLRRRSSAGGHDAPGPADPPSPGEDDFLLELEAVAADLADETDDPRGRRSRAAPAAGRAGGMEPGAAQSDVVRSEPDSLAEERIAELWKDAPEDTGPALAAQPEPDDAQDHDAAIRRQEPTLPTEPATDDDKADVSFDIDSLVRDDSDSGGADDDVDVERKGDPTAPAGEAAGDPDLHFSHPEARAVDSAAPAPTTGTLDHGVPDDRREDAALVTPGREVSVDTGPRAPGAASPDSGRKPVATDDERIDPGPDPEGGYGDSTVAPRTVADGRAGHAGTRAFSTEDFSEDEVQTKIDIAQVYMEMGDTDSARGFLEAVLAEGDAEQRNAAREMLAKLA